MEAVLVVALALSFAVVLSMDSEPYDNAAIVVEQADTATLKVMRLPARDHPLDPRRTAR